MGEAREGNLDTRVAAIEAHLVRMARVGSNEDYDEPPTALEKVGAYLEAEAQFNLHILAKAHSKE